MKYVNLDHEEGGTATEQSHGFRRFVINYDNLLPEKSNPKINKILIKPSKINLRMFF